MKVRITLALILLAVLPAGYTLGQAVFWPFTGTEELILPYPIEGTIRCPGGSPNPNWGQPAEPPCTPGSRVHFRDSKWLYRVISNDPRVNGDEVGIMNGNFDGWRNNCGDPGSGHMWGTVALEVKIDGTATGGIWEGTWTGTRRTGEDCKAQSSIRVVAHGSGPGVEGLKGQWDVTLDWNPPAPSAGVVSGRILSPGGK